MTSAKEPAGSGVVLHGGAERLATRLVNADRLPTTISWYRVAAGGHCSYHVHRGKDECWLIVAGRGRARVAETEYDVAAGEVFVDRSRSGRTDFSPKFSGRHAGPLPLERGRVELRVFVDRSSVEVFGNGGRATIGHLEPGRYMLWVASPAVYHSEDVEIRAGERTRVEIDLARNTEVAPLEVILHSQTGRTPLSGLRIVGRHTSRPELRDFASWVRDRPDGSTEYRFDALASCSSRASRSRATNHPWRR